MANVRLTAGAALRPTVMRLSIAAALLVPAMLLTPLMAGENFSYVFNDGTHSHMRSNGTIREIVRIAKKWDGPYLWVRMHDGAYLIRDSGVLNAGKSAFDEGDRLEPQLREAHRKLRPLERELEAIEERADELSDSLDDEDMPEAEREQTKATLRTLEEQLRSANAKVREAEMVTEKLEQQQDELERIAETKLERIIHDAIRAGLAAPVD